MKKLITILLCLPLMTLGQNVNIPDAIFKAYLVGNTAINTNGDTEIQLTEAAAFSGGIFCHTMNIADLTGIEYFAALTVLYCTNNQLTSLDVSANTALRELYCHNNQLTTLDVSQNTALERVDCEDNQLTSLDVSQNTALTNLDCFDNNLTSLDVSQNTALTTLGCSVNQLTTLDVSQNTALITLNCYNNQLTCLDVSNNFALTRLYCQNNLLEQLNTKNWNWVIGFTITAQTNNLTCVGVDNLGYANTNWINTFDNFVTFSTNCNYANPCNTTSAIQEHSTNKKLLRTIDVLGRETKGKKNEPLFYIYDDGTVEKRIVIE